MFSEQRKQNAVDLSWHIYVDLVRNLAKIGCRSITFTGGGEPLLNKHFDEMESFAVENGLEVGLVTNGILLELIKRPENFKFIECCHSKYL